MAFPIHRMRRLRATEAMRNLVRETLLDPGDFHFLPLFICPGEGVRREISSMPGHAQLSVDRLVLRCAENLLPRHRRRHSVWDSRNKR